MLVRGGTPLHQVPIWQVVIVFGFLAFGGVRLALPTLRSLSKGIRVDGSSMLYMFLGLAFAIGAVVTAAWWILTI